MKIWNTAPVKLHKLEIYWAKNDSIASIIECLAARHPDSIVESLKIKGPWGWDKIFPELGKFNGTTSLELDAAEAYPPTYSPTLQQLVDKLDCPTLAEIRIYNVCTCLATFTHKFPNLKLLDISSEENLVSIDDANWLELSTMMEKSILYRCRPKSSTLYEVLMAYALDRSLDYVPLFRWLAISAIQLEEYWSSEIVDFLYLRPPRLFAALSAIYDIETVSYFSIRVHVTSNAVAGILSRIPQAVSSLHLEASEKIAPDSLLTLFNSTSNVQTLEITLRNIPAHGTSLWPHNYFTHASVGYRCEVSSCEIRACYRRDECDPEWTLAHCGDQRTLDRKMLDSIELNKEIASWFEISECLDEVRLEAIYGRERV